MRVSRQYRQFLPGDPSSTQTTIEIMAVLDPAIESQLMWIQLQSQLRATIQSQKLLMQAKFFSLLHFRVLALLQTKA